MRVTRSIHWLTLAVVVCLAATAAVAAAPAAPGISSAPEAVSPGEAARVATVGDGCPTFSWGAVPGAKSYELVVWEVGAGGEVAGEGTRPALSERLPGSVTSWTPSLDRCLEPGGRYAWLVRAVGEKKVSPWSEARLSNGETLPPAGSFQQVEAADYYTCGLKNDGGVVCWGRDFDGSTLPPLALR